MSASFFTMDRLSAKEISFLKRQGYLIKKGVLNPELMRRAGSDEARGRANYLDRPLAPR